MATLLDTNIKKSDVMRQILQKEGVVILNLREYKKFLKYELEKQIIDSLVEEGLNEEKTGRTETMENFLRRDYPKLYEKYKN